MLPAGADLWLSLAVRIETLPGAEMAPAGLTGATSCAGKEAVRFSSQRNGEVVPAHICILPWLACQTLCCVVCAKWPYLLANMMLCALYAAPFVQLVCSLLLYVLSWTQRGRVMFS